MRVIVVGAGLTGLNCAASLVRAGVPVDVFEKEPKLTTTGPIVLHTSALRVLQDNEICGDIDMVTNKIRSIHFLKASDGKPFSELNVDVDPIKMDGGSRQLHKFGTEYRASKREYLAGKVLKELPEGTVHFGREVVDVVDKQGHMLKVVFKDGTEEE
eukprot:CAMPEP_0197850010 /NCGR_PEP_ID=MMETSP1438-20131217/13964_1 /TAXON_ID=1461541 /ORGANISM="Pterosperma sp., Strain CCMP1384" /LENGTH=156 /DNA_ID=CAMNT_0043462953 /DNA_START=77 /DNA_END=544 /DNA_ORIENTATION=-